MSGAIFGAAAGFSLKIYSNTVRKLPMMRRTFPPTWRPPPGRPRVMYSVPHPLPILYCSLGAPHVIEHERRTR